MEGMNKRQQMALLKAARATLAELQANPVTAQWQSTMEFASAVEFAAGPGFGETGKPIMAKIEPKRKGKKIPKQQYGARVWRDGKVLDEADTYLFAAAVRRNFADCFDGLERIRAKEGLFDLPDYLDPNKAEREAVMEQLSYCACGHKASQHRYDNDDNLLDCSDCKCRQFRYAQLEVKAA